MQRKMPAAPLSSQAPAAESLAEALSVVGDRWSLAIVAKLLEGPLRFGELEERLAVISANVLSQRLRALQAGGLVAASPYSHRPTRYLYELTSSGRELAGPLRLLAEWGSRRAGLSSQGPRHPACGTPLELRWYCPACDEQLEDPLDAAGEEDLVFA
jgi:DNA-binding HxlR family transcriptional regulator